MKHVFVATPMYGGMCTGAYTGSLINLAPILYSNDIMMYYTYMLNESLITRARNKLAFDFLKSPATHLMFIDSDIGFNPNDVAMMVKADKDIICGLYPKKEINWYSVEKAVSNKVPTEQLTNHTAAFVVNLMDGKNSVVADLDKPFEISNGGTGFMLIKREVFEKLIPTTPTYRNIAYKVTDKPDSVEIIHEFFATSIDEQTNILLSEDYHFCKMARKAGFKIYAAPWATLTHMGTYAFEGRVVPT